MTTTPQLVAQIRATKAPVELRRERLHFYPSKSTFIRAPHHTTEASSG